MYDHRLHKKNELVRTLVELKNEIPNLNDYEKQFLIGAKNYMKHRQSDDYEPGTSRFFQMPEAHMSEVASKLFQAYDTLDSTDELKYAFKQLVLQKLDGIRKSHINVNKWELHSNVYDNLIERRAENNHDLFRVFFLRYLTPYMREMIWKGILMDGIKLREYENNVKSEKVYTVSRDDIYLLQQVQ